MLQASLNVIILIVSRNHPAIKQKKQTEIMKIVLITKKQNGRTQTRDYKTLEMARHGRLVFGGRIYVNGQYLLC